MPLWRKIFGSVKTPTGGGRTMRPSRAGSPPWGSRMYRSPGDVCVDSMPGGTVTTAVTCALPTFEPAGQVSFENAAWLHLSAAFGSPTSPWGSTRWMLFTSSLDGFSENVVLTVTSGCAPPAVVDGR